MIDAARFWLLDVVVELTTPFSMLVSPKLEELFNREHHHLEREQLISLLEMLGRGDLIFAQRDGVRTGLDRSTIEEGLTQQRFQPGWLSYGLTGTGGALWEALTEPNWDLYTSGESDGEGNALVEAATLEHARTWLPHLGPFEEVIAGSEKVEPLTPWQATYWKELPSGVRIRYRKRRKAAACPLPKPEPEVPWYHAPRLA